MTDVRALALGILIRVERDRSHAAKLLDARGVGLPQRDRDLLRALVKVTLRNGPRLDHVLSRHVSRPLASLDLEVRQALRLGAAQLLLFDRIPAHAAVASTVAVAKEFAPRASGLVNAVLRSVSTREERGCRVDLPKGTRLAARLAVETSHPEWLVARWLALLGEAAARSALEADNADSPVDLLADPRAGTPEEIVAELLGDGVHAVRSAFAPLALTVTEGNAAAHPLVRTGRIAVVDAGAQALVELVPAADVVVDLAAAPGGKTKTLLARGKARRVVAVDRHLSRALRLRSSLAAAGRGGEAWVVVADGASPPLRRGSLLSVLLDAPCSGTGTLRKNPEIRQRLSPDDLPGFASIQARLLASAAGLLAPGGTVVYATCSLEPEENEDVRSTVLAKVRGLVPCRSDAASLPLPLASALGENSVFRFPPGPSNDGFSALALTKVSWDR